MGSFSRFLIPEAGFAEGAGRILDFGDSLNAYNFSSTPAEADANAAWADWMAVGEDMSVAFERIQRERTGCREHRSDGVAPQ